MSAAWLTGYTKKPAGTSAGELGQLRDPGLDDDGSGRRIDADRQIVEGHLEHVPAHELGLVGVVGERLYVGDQHVGRILALERHPILERADVVAEVERARGPVAGQDGLHRELLRLTGEAAVPENETSRPVRRLLRSVQRLHPRPPSLAATTTAAVFGCETRADPGTRLSGPSSGGFRLDLLYASRAICAWCASSTMRDIACRKASRSDRTRSVSSRSRLSSSRSASIRPT